MRALKGLLIYIGYILASALGLALILICIMYFVPSFRIAGIGMIHKNEVSDSEEIVLSNYSEYDNIVIHASSSKIGINVIPTEEENISYDMKINVFGFTNEIVEFQVVKHIEKNDRTLDIFFNITEPTGWLSTSRSFLNINIPTDLAFGLIADTDKGVVSVGKDKITTQLTDLSVSTGKGDLKLINIGSGETEKSLTLNTLSLKTNKGVFDLTTINNLTVLNNVTLFADNGEFLFKNIFASVDVTGNGVFIKADKISCGANGFSFIANNGKLKIGTLSCDASAENTIISENISLDIDNITGKTGIVTTYGDIDIDTTNSYTIIEDYDGDVVVNVAKATIVISTHMGDIDVGAYYASGKFSSDKGDITVNSRGEFSSEYYTEITNIDGDVKVKNEINRLSVITKGRGNVVVAFGKIKSGNVFQHKINTDTRGNCVVYMPTVGIDPYKFIAKGIISGEIGKSVSASESEQYYPSASNENKAIAATTCFFEFVGKIEFKSHSRLDLSGLQI